VATVLLTESCQDATTGKMMVKEGPLMEQHDQPTAQSPLDTVQQEIKQPPKHTEIRGKIFDGNSGLPLAGAHVRIRGSKQRAVTDSAGKFNLLSNNSSFVELEVSSPQFIPQTVQLNSKSDWKHVKVMMQEESFKMGDFSIEDDAANEVKVDCKNEKE
jgi:hypothetical protein